MSLYHPEDPNNLMRRPVHCAHLQHGGELVERVMFAGLYAQDQWTLRRFTFEWRNSFRPRDQANYLRDVRRAR